MTKKVMLSCDFCEEDGYTIAIATKICVFCHRDLCWKHNKNKEWYSIGSIDKTALIWWMEKISTTDEMKNVATDHKRRNRATPPKKLAKESYAEESAREALEDQNWAGVCSDCLGMTKMTRPFIISTTLKGKISDEVRAWAKKIKGEWADEV